MSKTSGLIFGTGCLALFGIGAIVGKRMGDKAAAEAKAELAEERRRKEEKRRQHEENYEVVAVESTEDAEHPHLF